MNKTKKPKLKKKSRAMGFGNELSEIDKKILLLFDKEKEVVLPVDLGLTFKETIEAMESLKRRQIIKDRSPYRLTKLGARLIKRLQQLS